MKKIIIMILSAIMVTPFTHVLASETNTEIDNKVIARINVMNVNKTVSVGNNIYATIVGTVKYKSDGTIQSASLSISHTTNNNAVLEFSYKVMGTNILYYLSVAGSVGTKIAYLF